MKILTLTQPWATLVAVGAKTIETRSWQTPYRGPIAIHVAKGLNGIFPGADERDLDLICHREPFKSALAEYVVDGYVQTQQLPRGMIVAVADLVDVVSTTAVGSPLDDRLLENRDELHFGDYSPGRYGWLLDNVWRLPVPMQMRGVRGLVDLDSATARVLDQQRKLAEVHA